MKKENRHGNFNFKKVLIFNFFPLSFPLWLAFLIIMIIFYFVWMPSPKLWFSSLLCWRSDIHLLFLLWNHQSPHENQKLLLRLFLLLHFPKPELLDFSHELFLSSDLVYWFSEFWVFSVVYFWGSHWVCKHMLMDSIDVKAWAVIGLLCIERFWSNRSFCYFVQFFSFFCFCSSFSFFNFCW